MKFVSATLLAVLIAHCILKGNDGVGLLRFRCAVPVVRVEPNNLVVGRRHPGYNPLALTNQGRLTKISIGPQQGFLR